MNKHFISSSISDDVRKEINSMAVVTQPTMRIVKSDKDDHQQKDDKPRKDPSLVMKDYIKKHSIKRNSITGFFERNGKSLTEQDINGMFIAICTTQDISYGYFDIYLNSSCVVLLTLSSIIFSIYNSKATITYYNSAML